MKQQPPAFLSATLSAAPRRAAAAAPITPARQFPHCPLITSELVTRCVSAARTRPARAALCMPPSVLCSATRSVKRTRCSHETQVLFLRAVVADPWYTRSYLLYALFVQRRDAELARTLFRLGAQVDPLDATLLQAWGLFESKQGKLRRAQQLLRRAVQLEPRNAPVLRWKCIFPHARAAPAEQQTL